MKNTALLFRTSVFALLPLLVAGCASQSSNDPRDLRSSLVVIELAKSTSKAADCPITVSIENKTGTPWDGASYNIALQDKRGVFAGRLIGSPRIKVKPGDSLTDKGTVSGFACDKITGAAPVYFGYYPAGKSQVSVHNANVRVRFN